MSRCSSSDTNSITTKIIIHVFMKSEMYTIITNCGIGREILELQATTADPKTGGLCALCPNHAGTVINISPRAASGTCTDTKCTKYVLRARASARIVT